MLISYRHLKVRALPLDQLFASQGETLTIGHGKSCWLIVSIGTHMGQERVFSKKKSPITSVKLFGMGKVSGITKKNFKIGTLEDFEKTYVLYVAMAEKPLSSGQKWFLR